MTKLLIKNKKGFTIIEIIVSISIFTIIMFISTGAILSVFDANRKSQSLRSVMDNLNLTIEDMTRTIRFGTNYHCDISQGTLSTPRDCSTSAGSTSMAVTDSSGTTVQYRQNTGVIERSVGGAFSPITSTDVTITNMTFRVYGSASYSTEGGSYHYQPQVILVVSGYAGAKASSQSKFTLETTVSQRVVDSQ